MMTLEQVQEKMKYMNLRVASSVTGIKYSILWRTINHKQKASYEVVKRLSDYLEAL